MKLSVFLLKWLGEVGRPEAYERKQENPGYDKRRISIEHSVHHINPTFYFYSVRIW